MPQMFWQEYQGFQCEGRYFQKGRVVNNQSYVYDNTDSDQESCQRFKFVVRGQQIGYHFNESFRLLMVLSQQLVRGADQDGPRVNIGHDQLNLLFLYLQKQLLLMQCCSDETVQKDDTWRNSIKQTKQSQPLKFKILSLLGLKEYIIDKYVFMKSEPKYSIVQQEGRKFIQCENKIKYPDNYQYSVFIVENQSHSIPAVMLHLKERQQYCGTVVYSHGNSSDLSNSLYFITKFAKTFPKFDYLIYDYTGYGQSKKTNTTQQTIVKDLSILIQNTKIPDEQIILWGFSLGTFPTAKVAAKRKFKGVILQSPLASIYSLFADNLTPYSSFTNDCFNIVDQIADISSFLIIIHSKDDEIIPFTHAKVLFQKYQMINSNPFCFLLEVTGLKHNQMHSLLCDRDSNQVRDSIHSYMKLMIEQKAIPTTKMFQLTKNKYFDNLGEISSAEQVDTTDKKTNDQAKQILLNLVDSFNFTEIKNQRQFDIDDISVQGINDFNYQMEIKTDKHCLYFETSKLAREETEHDSILNQRSIPDIYE